MLNWALTFFVIALIAAVLGFTGIAVAAAVLRAAVCGFSALVLGFTCRPSRPTSMCLGRWYPQPLHHEGDEDHRNRTR